MKWIISCLLLTGLFVCNSIGQETVEEYEILETLNVTTSGIPNFGFIEEVIDLTPHNPDIVVESIKVRIVFDSLYASLNSIGNDITSSDATAFVYFDDANSHNAVFINDHLLFDENAEIITYGEDKVEYPLVYEYEFSRSNIPTGLRIQLSASIGPVSPQSANGHIQMHMSGVAEITYNTASTTLVSLIDIQKFSALGGYEPTLLQEIATVEIPDPILDLNEPVGWAGDLVGDSIVYRGGLAGPVEDLTDGSPIFLNDVVETNKSSQLALYFIDETVFNINGNSRLAIDEYVYEIDASADSNFQVFPGWFFYFATQFLEDIRGDTVELDNNGVVVGSLGIRGRFSEPLQDEVSMELVRPFDGTRAFGIVGFDYAFLDPGMSFEIWLGGIQLATIYGPTDGPSPAGLEHFQIDTSEFDGQFLGHEEFRIISMGPSGSRFAIDNVTGPGFTDPGFNQGIGAWSVRGEGEVGFAQLVNGDLCSGSGNFTHDIQDRTNSPGYIADIVTADMNVDGIMDLVILSVPDSFYPTEYYEISVKIGDGNGDFGDPISYELESRVSQKIHIADVNTDGYPDVLFTTTLSDGETQPVSYDQGVNVLIGDKLGGLIAPQTIVPSQYINTFRPVDVNGDGRSDIVVSPRLVYISDGELGFTRLAQPSSVSVSPRTIPYGDFDGDGDYDLVSANANDLQLVYSSNDGGGVFTSKVIGSVLERYDNSSVLDIDQDGNLDIVFFKQVPLGVISVVYGNGDGSFEPEEVFLNDSVWKYDFDVADLDSNGYADIIYTQSDGVYSLFNNSDRTYTHAQVTSEIGRAGFTAFDIDRNGSVDIVGRTRSTFTPVAKMIALFSECVEPCIADLNGDGSLDFFDVSAFLTAFSQQDTAADFTGDGSFDFFDVSAFLIAFSAGCP